MKKIISAKLLTCCEGWESVNLDYNDFKFICNYSPCCNKTQIWIGSNGDIFILRNVKIKEIGK